MNLSVEVSHGGSGSIPVGHVVLQQQTSVKDVYSKSTFQQRLLIVLMCMQSFVSFAMVALISPFYPSLALEKGATVTQVSVIFSSLFLVIFITSPIYGKYLPQIGPKFMYLAGLYVRIVADMCFGLLNYMPSGAVFITMSFVIRIISALGASAFNTAAFAIISKEFPDNISIMFGLLQAMIACGLMSGPPIGGILYDIGYKTAIDPYTFPFLCVAAFALTMTIINTFVMPLDDSQGRQSSEAKPDASAARKKKGMLSLVCNPRVAVNLIAVCIIFMPLVHTEISLELHLQQFHLSQTYVGLMFTCMTAVYGLFSSLWGWIDNHWFYPRLQALLGCTVYVFACLLIGPSPLFGGTTSHLWMVGVGLSLIGFSVSSINTASFKDSFNQALNMGMPKDFSTSGIVSGLFMSSFTTGGFLGPMIGGAITEAFETNGYAWSMTIYSFLLLTLFLIFITTSVFSSRKFLKKKSIDTNDETVPLL